MQNFNLSFLFFDYTVNLKVFIKFYYRSDFEMSLHIEYIFIRVYLVFYRIHQQWAQRSKEDIIKPDKQF